MPVRKYRSVEDMPRAIVGHRDNPSLNLRVACELSVTALRLAPKQFRPGVRRYRSIEEAAEDRERWERQRTR